MSISKSALSLHHYGQFAISTVTGQIGLIVAVTDEMVTLQCGPSGPFEIYFRGDCRLATKDEIREARLDGVGHKSPSKETKR